MKNDGKSRSGMKSNDAGDVPAQPRSERSEKDNQFQSDDDGTITYLWRGTLTVLRLLIGFLIYVALFETVSTDTEYNAKRGMTACLVMLTILITVAVTPDGPFVRPHPAFWRLIFVLSILYQLCMIFVLFQNAHDARQLLKLIDPDLGVGLFDKGYGGNCHYYDSNSPLDLYHNINDKMDLFVPMHFFGWFLITMMFRDWWLCTGISLIFEILEYTLEHQLPNFSECRWGDWMLLDALLCNGGGIWFGVLTLKLFKVHSHFWRGRWSIPNYREKLKRITAQCEPTSVEGWRFVLGVVLLHLAATLNIFYLNVLWVPPGHALNLINLILLMLCWGGVAIRETFQYLEDPLCTKFGRQSWVVMAILSTEFLIVAKFDSATITKPITRMAALFWLGGIIFSGYTIWSSALYPKTMAKSEENLIKNLDKSNHTSLLPDSQNAELQAKLLANRSFNLSGGSRKPLFF